MKYMLIMHQNPTVMARLSAAQMEEIGNGHQRFMEIIRESGEMISTAALAQPEDSAVVRVREGVKVVTDGPYLEAKEFLGGYYLVECADKERAQELAALIPDAKVDGLGIEVRPVVFTTGSQS